MSDKTAAFVDTHGLGRLDERLPLRGKLPIPGVGLVKAEFCYTPRGAWVVAAESDSKGLALNLLERSDFRYERRALGDKIRVADCVLGVSRARAGRVRELLGLSRLRQRHGALPTGAQRTRASTPFVEPVATLERAWLELTLADDEILLAWIHGVSAAFVSSPIESNAHAELRLMVTSRETRLVAITELGDVRVESLDPRSADVKLEQGSLALRTPNWEFRSGRKHDELTADLLRLLQRPTDQQLLWIAQKSWLSRASTPGSSEATPTRRRTSPRSVNLMAFPSRFNSTWRSRTASPTSASGASAETSTSRASCFSAADIRRVSAASATVSRSLNR